MANDLELGLKIHAQLKALKIESPINFEFDYDNKATEQLVADSLTSVGFDLTDNSLANTPKRVAKMYRDEIFKGCNYANFPAISTFDVGHNADTPIIIKNITVHSMCEHHLLPIIGKAHVAYIPTKKVVGLSKINRVVDFFARRPQVQERLTAQLIQTLHYVLDTPDIAVIIEAEHMCVKLRGVEDACSTTITSTLKGRFLAVPALRTEFLTFVKN